MNARNRLGALLAAGALVMALGAGVAAAPPTYGISLTKSANPANVPPSGGSVVYTITVTGTGTGDLQTVNIDDGMAGCTLAGPTGDQPSGAGAGKLEEGETWTYSCTVTGVTPGTQNTAVVNACHNVSACNQSAHDATDSDSVTVGEGPDVTDPPATDPPATDPPATDPPGTEPPATTDPGGGEGGVEVTQANTDTIFSTGAARPGDNSWMLVVSLGLLLASIVVLSPSKPVRERQP